MLLEFCDLLKLDRKGRIFLVNVQHTLVIARYQQIHFDLFSQFYRSILLLVLLYHYGRFVTFLSGNTKGLYFFQSSRWPVSQPTEVRISGLSWCRVVSPLSVPSFFCAFTSMALQGNASAVPTSQHHCIGGTTQKSSYTFVVQGQKSTIDLQSITDTIKL